MYDISNHITLRQCQRSFDMDIPVDADTLTILKNTADSFISSNNLEVNNFFITNKHEIKIIHSSAMIENEPAGLEWKTNTQILAPLLVLCQPLKAGDAIGFTQAGRLYSKLGLIAIERGYQTGFCLCINAQALDAWEITKKYSSTDPETGHYLPHIFLSIGKPMDANKPYNWSAMYNKNHQSHKRLIDFNIQIKNRP